ncbi:MAG: hypothetical protein NT169_26745 [Chloroflexi bacterium]|nr:hypothetical protein [Chloroflexota bacterium]
MSTRYRPRIFPPWMGWMPSTPRRGCARWVGAWIAALALGMWALVAPIPILAEGHGRRSLAAETGTATSSSSPTATASPSPTATPSPTVTPTATPSPTLTAAPTSSPTAVPAAVLKLQRSYTIPEQVVAGATFQLFVVLENVGTLEADHIGVTFVPDQSEITPKPVNSTNARYILGLSPRETVLLAQDLQYDRRISGLQGVEIQIDVLYQRGGQQVRSSERVQIAVLVQAPPLTSTPTATATATASATASPTATPTTPPTATTTATATLRPLPSATPVVTTEPSPRPTEAPASPTPTAPPPATPTQAPVVATATVTVPPVAVKTAPASRGIPVDLAASPLVVIESYTTAPSPLLPGLPFTLTLTLRNIGKGEAQTVLVTWQTAQIAPLGIGYVRQIPALAANTSAPITGRYYAEASMTAGAYKAPVQIVFEDSAGQGQERWEELNFIVGAPPPRSESLWQRLLRLLFGGGGSR